MMHALRLSSAVLAVSLSVACSSSPSRLPPPPQAPPADPSGGSAAPARQPDSADSRTNLDDEMIKRGYKPALYRGERVYCRNEVLTGSNLASKICLTADQIEDRERTGKDILNGNRPAGCMPKSGCN